MKHVFFLIFFFVTFLIISLFTNIPKASADDMPECAGKYEGDWCAGWDQPDNYCCGTSTGVCNTHIDVKCSYSASIGGLACDADASFSNSTSYHDACSLGAGTCWCPSKTCNYVSAYDQCEGCSIGKSQHVINKQWSDGSGWCGSVGACDQVDHSCNGDSCNWVNEYNECDSCGVGLSRHVIDKRWASNSEQCGSIGTCNQTDHSCGGDTCNLVNEYNVCCGDGLSKHVIDKRWASNSEQCGSIGACDQADASCAAGTPKYKCSGTSCIRDDAGGTFTTSNCSNTCSAVVAKYKCNGASCIRDDAGGTFTTSNCNNTCSGSDPTYDTNLYIDPSNPITGTATTFTATGTMSCSANIDLTVGNGMYNCSQTGGFTCSGGNPKDTHPCWWRWSCTARNPATYTATFYGNNDKITGNTECISSASYTVRSNSWIVGKVWNDVNDNGSDAGESGVSGMRVYIDNSSTYVTTDANGSFSYYTTPGSHNVFLSQTNLDSGNWIMGSITPISKTVTVPVNGSVWASFGLLKAGKIHGSVWENTYNPDGIFDAADRGVNNIKVYLDGVQAATTAINSTYRDGYYIKSRVPVGNHTVSVNLADFSGSNWFFNTVSSRTITVTWGGLTQASFGLQRKGTILGNVWVDLNGDDQKDAGEPGVSINVYSKKVTDPTISSTVNNPDTGYTTDNIIPVGKKILPGIDYNVFLDVNDLKALSKALSPLSSISRSVSISSNGSAVVNFPLIDLGSAWLKIVGGDVYTRQ